MQWTMKNKQTQIISRLQLLLQANQAATKRSGGLECVVSTMHYRSRGVKPHPCAEEARAAVFFPGETSVCKTGKSHIQKIHQTSDHFIRRNVS